MHRSTLRQIAANLYMWNPYLHMCNPNLHSHLWPQPTAIAAAAATAPAVAATIILPGASCPPPSPPPTFLLLFVDCCLPRHCHCHHRRCCRYVLSPPLLILLLSVNCCLLPHRCHCRHRHCHLGCAFHFLFRFLPGLIFRNSGYSAEFPGSGGTHVGIKSFQGKIYLVRNSGLRNSGRNSGGILCHV